MPRAQIKANCMFSEMQRSPNACTYSVSSMHNFSPERPEAEAGSLK